MFSSPSSFFSTVTHVRCFQTLLSTIFFTIRVSSTYNDTLRTSYVLTELFSVSMLELLFVISSFRTFVWLLTIVVLLMTRGQFKTVKQFPVTENGINANFTVTISRLGTRIRFGGRYASRDTDRPCSNSSPVGLTRGVRTTPRDARSDCSRLRSPGHRIIPLT